MAWIENLPHSCGSSDALQVWEDGDGYNGFCFSCNTYVPDPYDGGTPSKEVASEAGKWERDKRRMAEAGELASLPLPERALEAWALEDYGVKVAVSQQDGVTPTAAYFPVHKGGEPTGYKVRILDEKKMFGIGDCKKPDLFGWDRAVANGGRKLFITEGEFDALALYQTLVEYQSGTKWEEYKPSVVSLANGAASAGRDLARHADKIRRQFKEVVLVFDMDEAGDEAVKAAMQALPLATRAQLPAKDANECILTGRNKGLVKAVLFNSAPPKKTKFVTLDNYEEQILSKPKMGLSWPWPKLTALTRGIRTGETIYLGAGPKMGKTTCVYQIAEHYITEHQQPVLMACLEEIIPNVGKRLAEKNRGKVFTDPSVPFDEEELRKGVEAVKPRVHLLDAYQEVSWDELREDIVYQAQETGAKAVFLDPITNLTNGISSGDANTKLQGIAQSASVLARDLDLTMFIFCHLNNPDSGPSHQRGGEVLSHQFAGSRAMMRSCHMMLGLEGDKDPRLPEDEQNMRQLVVIEDRAYGATGVVPLFYDKHSTRLVEL